ncbi:DUF3152 domain-containing protein [Blastococcus saxobsidens]|uniref:Uncharacterized protein DUF3152 n=1 Tax=Blastococcus saxobsidens TaxID=138336 RepID=A0A4Q7Y7R0_9ACTN|nr:DUF3152 domain-containing protein [Blastococcus saxobsidens]RZU32970.1 uncharacterized protein DUF3152 [Blastococcus saxobsidens]
MGGRLTDGRPAGRPRPLAAHPEPRVRTSRRPPERERSWFRRFVRRHGWRAYALPFLAVATVVVLVDLVLHPPGSAPATPAAAPTTATPPAAATTSGPAALTASAPTAPAQGDAGPTEPVPAAVADYVEQGAGTLSIVDGSSQVYGTGPLKRFVVEVEDGIGVDGAVFAEAVTQTLADPRSWGNGGRMSFQRVGIAEADARQYDFRVSLVSPGNMETYCPGVGTGGYTSCRYGERAVINLARWATAVPHYDGDLATYRPYVINHEVGHALGNGHRPCPGAGQIAPVMQQQTLGLDGCGKNAWPFP